MVKNLLFMFFISVIFLQACANRSSLEIKGDIPIGTRVRKSKDLSSLVSQHNIQKFLFVASDSTAVELRADLINQVYLYNRKGVWHATSNALPRTMNLRDIVYIAVKSDYLPYRLAIFDGNNEQIHITAYDFTKSRFSFVGTSEKRELEINKYTQKENQSIPLILRSSISPAASIERADSLIIIHTSGKEAHHRISDLETNIDFDGYSWFIPEDRYDPIIIIWRDFPQASIYDIYPLLEEKTAQNPILLFFVDGLGWNMLDNMKARGYQGFFNRIDPEPLRVAYPPRTLTAYEIIGTGEFNTNIFQKEKPELFSTLDINAAYIIENDQSFFSSKFPIILNSDTNNNGSIDDEIFETAIQYLEEDFDLLLVHFHSIDDTAHKYGPYTRETRDQIELVGGYIEQILDKWKGDYIIFSDHGLHYYDGSGRHGTNEIEDMIGVWYKK